MTKKSFLLITFIVSLLMATTVSADAKKGQKYYLKKLKACKKDGFENGAYFALEYTREEWEQFKDDDSLIAQWKTMCPSAEKRFTNMKERDIENLYDFVWKHASDGDIPSCG